MLYEDVHRIYYMQHHVARQRGANEADKRDFHMPHNPAQHVLYPHTEKGQCLMAEASGNTREKNLAMDTGTVSASGRGEKNKDKDGNTRETTQRQPARHIGGSKQHAT